MKKVLGVGLLLVSLVSLNALEVEINPWEIVSKGEIGAVIRIDSTGEIPEDLFGAGALVEINARVGGTAALFGAQIRLLSEVSGDFVAGGAVIEASGDIKGKANLAGAVLYLEGTFTDSLEAGGAVIFVSGHIKGPVMLNAAEIYIEDGAVIEDTLRYNTAGLHIAEGATLLQGVKKVIVEAEEVEMVHEAQERPRRTFGGWVLKTFLGFLFLAGAGIFLALAFPTHFKNVTSELMSRQGIWVSPLTGFIALVAGFLLPIILSLLSATIVGIGAAIFLGGLYLLGFLFSGVYAGTAMGRWLLSITKKKNKRSKEPHIILSMLLGTFIVAVLCGIPYFVGVSFYFVTFIFGFGAFLVHLWEARKPRKIRG
ncbi:hypothetical protein JXM67_02505 [candidate division WOR-3 bacterium]|nr:hypothetical protein [candidate division WOR-3 bacterium]